MPCFGRTAAAAAPSGLREHRRLLQLAGPAREATRPPFSSPPLPAAASVSAGVLPAARAAGTGRGAGSGFAADGRAPMRSLDHLDEVLRTRACHVRAQAQWHASLPVTAEGATSLPSSERRKKQDLCASAVVCARGVIRAIVVWWAPPLYPALYSVLAVTAYSLLCSKASGLRIKGWKGTRALLSPPSRPDLQNAPARPPPPLFRSQQPQPPLPPLWPPLPPPPSLRPGDSTGAGARC